MKHPERQGGYPKLTSGLIMAGHLIMPHTHALPDISSFHFPPPNTQSTHADIFFADVVNGEQDHSEHDLRHPGRMRGVRLPSTDSQEGHVSSDRHRFPRRKSRETRGLDSQQAQELGAFATGRSNGDDYRTPMQDVGRHAEDLSKALSLYGSAMQAEIPDSERPGRLRQFGKIEYDLRRFDSLPADTQQEVGRSVIKILADVPTAPDGWIPMGSTKAEQERINLALTLLADAGMASVALGFVYQLGKKRRKALPALFALAAVVSACGGNVAETATVVFGGGQQTTEQVPPPIPQQNSPSPEASATTGLSGSGGEYPTCEAAAASFLAPRMSPQGAIVPSESMASHSGDPNKWSEADKVALVDDQGNSIAPRIDQAKDAIQAIDGRIRVGNVWSGEGYVLGLQNVEGQYVWAMGKDGIPRYRPDLADDDTDKFRIILDPLVDGEKRYVVTGGCGVLGVFDKKENMIAMYKPLTDEWVMLTGENAAQEAFGTPAIPAATEQLASAIPLPSETPTPEPTATPDRVASFEIPADHAPFWAYDGGISVITTSQNGQDFALYSAIFQSYLVSQRVELINGAEEIVVTAVYQTPDGAQRSVDVVFDTFVKYYDLQARKPLEGRGDTIISREKLQLDIDNWIKKQQQIPLSVIIGYGGVPDSVKNRDCTERCSTIDNVLLTMSPDDLLNFYSNSGIPTDNKPIRLVVLTVNIGPNDLWSAGSISNFPEKQIRQFPFKP